MHLQLPAVKVRRVIRTAKGNVKLRGQAVCRRVMIGKSHPRRYFPTAVHIIKAPQTVRQNLRRVLRLSGRQMQAQKILQAARALAVRREPAFDLGIEQAGKIALARFALV